MHLVITLPHQSFSWNSEYHINISLSHNINLAHCLAKFLHSIKEACTRISRATFCYFHVQFSCLLYKTIEGWGRITFKKAEDFFFLFTSWGCMYKQFCHPFNTISFSFSLKQTRPRSVAAFLWETTKQQHFVRGFKKILKKRNVQSSDESRWTAGHLAHSHLPSRESSYVSV